jgi:hypothetical protein
VEHQRKRNAPELCCAGTQVTLIRSFSLGTDIDIDLLVLPLCGSPLIDDGALV